MQSPLLSIVVPFYNAQDFISRCIESVVQQTFTSWELILVNDGSKDNGLEIAESYAKTDARVKVITQENAGPSAARNHGIDLAVGTYITFIDADDYVDKDYLQELVQPFLDCNDIQLSCGGYFEISAFRPNGVALHDLQCFFKHSQITKQQFLTRIFTGVSGVLWGKMFVLATIREHDLKLNPKVKLSEDLSFVIKYTKFIDKIAIVQDHLYFYNRLNETGLSGKLGLRNIDDILTSNQNIRDIEPEIDPEALETALQRRLFYGLIKISRDICERKASMGEIKKELNYLNRTFLAQFYTEPFYLNGEKKMHFILMKRHLYTLTILYNRAVSFTRNKAKKRS